MVRTGSPSAGSILMTSAPKSASKRPQKGPATVEPISSTRVPVSGPWASAVGTFCLITRSEHVGTKPHKRLLGASEVLPLQTFCLISIAAAHGGEHGLVLAQPHFSASRQDDNATDHHIGLLVDSVEHLGDHHVACSFDDPLAQTLIAGDIGVEVAVPDEVRHRSAKVLDEVLPRRRGHVLGREPDAQTLEDLTHVVELEDMSGVEPHDDGAAVGNALD